MGPSFDILFAGTVAPWEITDLKASQPVSPSTPSPNDPSAVRVGTPGSSHQKYEQFRIGHRWTKARPTCAGRKKAAIPIRAVYATRYGASETHDQKFDKYTRGRAYKKVD
jgi:hypothetical protein